MSGVCASRLLPNSFLMRALAGLAAGVCDGQGLLSWFDSFGAVPFGGKGGRLVVLALGKTEASLLTRCAANSRRALGTRYP